MEYGILMECIGKMPLIAAPGSAAVEKVNLIFIDFIFKKG